jgi:signal peptidase I
MAKPSHEGPTDSPTDEATPGLSEGPSGDAGDLPLGRRAWRGLKPFLVVCLVVFPFRSAVADWNDVPTGSMQPSILIGDRIVVDKLAYDLKVPFTTWHLAEWDGPARGDVVVFYSPKDGARLVKRVVGLPGETIELRGNQLWIDGVAQRYSALDPTFTQAMADQPDGSEARRKRVFASEHLGGREHPVMLQPGRSRWSTWGPTTVPEGHYFMMGDNRDNSFDSRGFGPVPRDQIVGRAFGAVSFSPYRSLP